MKKDKYFSDIDIYIMNKVVCLIPVSGFSDSKTRLSPFLSSSERRALLKFMLKDIVSNIMESVDEIFVVSRDYEVLDYAMSLDCSVIEEKNLGEASSLNNALVYSMSVIRKEYGLCDVIIIPSDIPLIRKEHVIHVRSSDCDVVISPSMGGGTNLLFIRRNVDFIPEFGEFSFDKHLDQVGRNDLSYEIFDSFYLSVDVNTPYDLGEVMLHGRKTCTYGYLSELGIRVENSRLDVRLNVKRD